MLMREGMIHCSQTLKLQRISQQLHVQGILLCTQEQTLTTQQQIQKKDIQILLQLLIGLGYRHRCMSAHPQVSLHTGSVQHVQCDTKLDTRQTGLERGEGGGGKGAGWVDLDALHHSGVKGLALVSLKAVALQPGVL